ncbi:hypothetical protein BVX98_01835 [bacterium F11]|nr:hypothetical protein BVX98_01835 [bacterium F11]
MPIPQYHEGWILDAYPDSHGMRVWILDANGRISCYFDHWAPPFILKVQRHDVALVRQALQQFLVHFSFQPVEKKDFFTNRSCVVIEIRVHNPLFYSRVVDHLLRLSVETASLHRKIELFNADLNLTQYYFYERGLFPLAHCFYSVDANGVLQEWQKDDSCWALDYEFPPLRYAYLGFESLHDEKREESSYMDPNQCPGGSKGSGRRGGYLLTLGRELGKGTSYLFNESEEELIHSLNRHMKDWDPDILLTDWGDSYIMPRLQMHSNRTGIPLLFSRDPQRGMASASHRTYFSYGQIHYRAGPRFLFGRLHLDTRNSFTIRHSQLEGLFEIGRVAKIPFQRVARTTIGTSLSSIQQEWAVQNDYLIPMDKGQTEDFRQGDELISSDRGGLVYEPEIGWHEDLIEFDFVSMYPEIMIRHNVTPEAINCDCCPDNKVPEISHHICRHRKGIIPQTLAPIVKKRRLYKQRIAADHPNKAVYRCRSEAFKWALVTCFGYLGFRNARFGRIEAHECVNAYSREALLKAKEAAEEEGFHFLHAIIDSLWLSKKGICDEDIERLRQKIEDRTGLPLGFEGRYRWIRFCPSRENARVGVPNRYFGAFINGDLKVRGIELRRHDTPPFIVDLQQALLAVMSKARGLVELERLQPKLEGIVESFRDRLRSGHVSPLELAISFRLSQEPSEYVHDTLSALAAKKCAASGVDIHPGEIIRYIVVQEKDAIKDWRIVPLSFVEDHYEYDIRYYERLCDRAIDILPFSRVSSHESGKKQVPQKGEQLTLFP